MAERTTLDQGWIEWTRLNIKRDCDKEGILEILLDENFDVKSIREAMGDDFPEHSELLKKLFAEHKNLRAETAKELNLEPADKRESVTFVKRALAKLNPRNSVVERRSYLGRAEFLEQYYAANRPVILTGLMDDWPALTKWTPDYLKKTCGSMSVEIQSRRNSTPDFEIVVDPLRREVHFDDYVDLVYKPGETNDYYMTARNGFFQRKGANKLLNDLGGFPEYLDMNAGGEWMFMWFGPQGTITPLHHDELNIFLAQVVGRKRVKLIPPDELDLVYNHFAVYSQVDAENPDFKRFPKYKNATVMEVDLLPGEVLFLPAGWWHHVRSLDPSVSLSYTNFVFPNNYNWVHPHPNGGAAKSNNGYGDSKAVAESKQSTKSASELKSESNSKTAADSKEEVVRKIDHRALNDLPAKRLRHKYHAQPVDTNGKVQLLLIENLLTDEECDEFASLLNDKNMRPSTVTSYKEGYRTSSSSDFTLDESEFVRKIDLKLATALGINLSHTEGVQAQKYKVGQEFKPHTDYFQPDTEEYEDHCLDRGNRTWTVMVYLQDTPKGGGTRFTKLNQTFYPKKGRALAWNNLTKDGLPNANTMHWGMPVQEGEKLILTKWFRERGSGEMFI